MKILLKAIFSLGIVLFILGCCEFLAWTQMRHNIYDGDSGYFWHLKPNLDQQIANGSHPFQLTTNSLGFRDTELTSKPVWLFLGCSTTLGWGVEQEDTFLHLLQQEIGDTIDIVNAGQPGWSSVQVLHDISRLQSLNPTLVVIGLGVRDAQRSFVEDKYATPTPWLFRRNIFQWLQQIKGQSAGNSSKGTVEPPTFRVLPDDFQQNLSMIVKAFPKADVLLYQFPQVTYSPDHALVLEEMDALQPPAFTAEAFFVDDPIHLNPQGHRQLANWLMDALKVSTQD